MHEKHCIKSVCIQGYSGSHSVQLGENTDQNNFEYGQFLPSENVAKAKVNLN